ncbi:MAG: T9SS type A sorting domain-containing protein [Bacteroidota bacterium]
MKKIYLSILSIAFVMNANAQLSLTKAFNEPVIGDVNMNTGYDTTTAIPKNTGAGQTWNFSSLTTNTLVDVATFTTVASTPSAAAYPTASFAEADGAGGYNYWKTTATQYELMAFESTQASVSFSNTAIAAVWPVSMGYNNMDAFAGTANVTGVGSGTASGTLAVMGSGTGTLIIPGGMTFTSVLQVKSVQTLDLSFLGGFVTVNSITTDYDYYHASQKFPILSVSYNNTTGAQTSSSASVFVNNMVITGINDQNFDASFSIFPNPAKNNFNVKLNNVSNGDCNVEIVNSVGQTVKVVNLGNTTEITNNISISDLAQGMYMIKTTLGDKISVRKLIVE